LFNIFLLAGFVTATQQYQQFRAFDAKVNAIPLANKNTHFRHPFTNRLYIAKIASFYTRDAVGNSNSRFSCGLHIGKHKEYTGIAYA